MTAFDIDEVIMDAEAKWSLGDNEGAAATLERALTAAWGRPTEVARISEVATRLADARSSEADLRFAERAAEGAEALDANPTDAAPAVQLAVFTVVVIVVLTVQYLEVVR